MIEPTPLPPAGPWQIVVADGSGNRWTIDGDGPGARWRFAPVQPSESSSGVYSGGTPGEGDLDADTTAAVWTRVRGLLGDPSVQVVDRAMGTVMVHLEVGGRTRHAIVKRGPGDEVVSLLRAGMSRL